MKIFPYQSFGTDYKSRYNSVIASRIYGQHLYQECNACISIKVHARLEEGFRKENWNTQNNICQSL